MIRASKSPWSIFIRHGWSVFNRRQQKCLKSFGEAAGDIGFDKPLGHYSEAEALQVVDAIVTCYTESMVEHHETTKFPPVHGMAPTADPMANPFADLEDDLPWEEGKGEKR